MNRKNIIFITAFLSLGLLFLSACIKEKWEEPDKITYNVNFRDSSDYQVISIDALKLKLLGDTTLIKDNFVIEGTVISSDESGNIYKELYIQDSSFVNDKWVQAGLILQIDLTNLFIDYPVGQKIAIKCKGLYVGLDNGVKKLGSLYSEINGSDTLWRFGRIQGQSIVDKHIFKMSGGEPIKPKIIKLNQLSDIYLSTLVTFENVQFTWRSIGETFADPNLYASGIGHYIQDEGAGLILLYNSSYATFASDTIPEGNGSITGLYGKYGTTLQFYINDITDVNFNNPRVGPFYIEDFPQSVGSFTQMSLSGTAIWAGQSYDDGCVVLGNSYNENDWLISPAFDFTGKTGLKVGFRHAVNFLTSWNDFNLFVSTNYDGVSSPASNGTWTEITGWETIPGNSYDFYDTQYLDISTYDGNTNVYFAFQYKSSSSAKGTWEISEFRLKSN